MKRTASRVLCTPSFSHNAFLVQRPTTTSLGNVRRYAGGHHGDFAPSKPRPVISHDDVWPNGYLWNVKPGYERPPESWEAITAWSTAISVAIVFFSLKYGPASRDPSDEVKAEIERRRQMRADGTDPWTEDMHIELVPKRTQVPPLYQEDGLYHYWFARRRFTRKELEEQMNQPYPKDRQNL